MFIKFNFDKNLIILLVNLSSFIIITSVIAKKSEIIFLKDLFFLISFIISIICLKIQKQSSKTSHNPSKIFRPIIAKELENQKVVKNFRMYLSIFIIFILFFILSLINEIHIIHKLEQYPFYSNIIFIGIIFIGIIKKEKLYNHHKLSFIILFFIMFFNPILFKTFISIPKYIFIMNSIYSIGFYFSMGLLRGLIKVMMENKFISPFFFSALNSILHMIIDLIIYGYYYFIVEEQERVSYFNSNWTEKVLSMNYTYMILYFIGLIVYLICDILVCYFNSPYHQCVCDILASFIGTFYDFSIENIIIGIINLFFSCVSTEIIILKFCDLDKNTKIQIQERSSERLSLNLSNLSQKSNLNDSDS